MKKINKVIKFEDLPGDALAALSNQYPEGWEDFVRKITKPNGDSFYAINVDTKDISYLAKVSVNIDAESTLDKMKVDFTDKRAEREAANHSKQDNGSSGDINEDEE